MTIAPPTCGDLNGNDLVEILEAIIMMQIVVGSQTPTTPQLVAGDVDSNGTLEVLAVIVCMQHLVGRIPVLECSAL